MGQEKPNLLGLRCYSASFNVVAQTGYVARKGLCNILYINKLDKGPLCNATVAAKSVYSGLCWIIWGTSFLIIILNHATIEKMY